MGTLAIAVDDPRADDVSALVARHLAFARRHTPPADVHALGVDGLLGPNVTLYSARRDGELLAIGALHELDERHGELKAMHTAEAARRKGVGQAMLDHLLAVARQRGYQRVSLETGTMDAFAPARSLYRRSGFAPCAPFAAYSESPSSACLTLRLS
jgi:putative acetyltransferase